jgi:uncharacterized protein (TIGR03435 family)
MSKLRPAVVGLALSVALLTPLVAQDKPTFDVATIKRHTSDDQGSTLQVTPGGGFRAINAPLFTLLASAYADSQFALRPSQIVDAPRWTEGEHYDIVAKPPDNAAQLDAAAITTARFRLQALLEERFKLRVHRDKREMPVFALVRVRPNTLGPQMAKSTLDCGAQLAACGFRGGPIGRIRTEAITPAILSALFANATGRIVLDRTGLQGWFRVDLEWSPDQTATDKPSLFTAVQEQLGLKLESTKGPVDVLVIDHVERPSEN